MRKVLALSVATCLLAGVTVAQTPTPNRPNPPNATVAPPNTTTDQSHNPATATTSNANDRPPRRKAPIPSPKRKRRIASGNAAMRTWPISKRMTLVSGEAMPSTVAAMCRYGWITRAT